MFQKTPLYKADKWALLNKYLIVFFGSETIMKKIIASKNVIPCQFLRKNNTLFLFK